MLLLLAACQSGGPPRYVAEADHFSFVELDGWSPHRERDSLVFSQSGSDATIAVRSVPVAGDWVQDRVPALVTAATERVLRGLPGATVTPLGPFGHDGLAGAMFDVTYQPASAGGRRYQRIHTVLVGKERVLHVALTWPDGVDAGDATRAFRSVISTIREEG